jgi:hypothetical protein
MLKSGFRSESMSRVDSQQFHKQIIVFGFQRMFILLYSFLVLCKTRNQQKSIWAGKKDYNTCVMSEGLN